MPSSQLEQIKDEELRATLSRASDFLDEGKNYECVKECSEAYLALMSKHPEVLGMLKRVLETERVKAGLERGMIRFAPLMWPRMASKMHFDDSGEPKITFDRTALGFGEAVQYYEFTMNLAVEAEKGEVKMPAAGGGFGFG